jgi:hypothetical protein
MVSIKKINIQIKNYKNSFIFFIFLFIKKIFYLKKLKKILVLKILLSANKKALVSFVFYIVLFLLMLKKNKI